ncbi:hypothetical protein POM88_025339 [Heracleum sosnowskyi]|uniref:SWIM-type domain-containing protein n=1 Tax=Heracleum sosnowskyi TaxID=360622 RepID=A0AAD8I6U5_9APIA|nr:hypothetical protein POM88_025339 [Heracleum sosnowskyi]
MYECHHLWIPAHFRDDPLLGILRTTFWSESAKSFFSNYHQSGDTLTQFYLRFDTAMSKQHHVNSELNHKSDVAFPSTDTELFLEKEAAELYTREMFYKFQKRVKEACYHLAIKNISGVEVKKLVVYDPKAAKNFEVVHTLESNKVECSCKLFERFGLPCRHLILTLNQVPVQKIPRHLLLNRWMKNAEKNASRVFTITSDDKETFDMIVNDIWFDFNSCVGLAGDDKEALDFVKTGIKDINHNLRDWKFKGKQIALTKKSVVEKLIGTEIPDTITVQPPNECRNKGCGTKRIKSAAEKASMLAGKGIRSCSYYNAKSFHDRRNCPVLNAKAGLKKTKVKKSNILDQEKGQKNKCGTPKPVPRTLT